MYDSVDAIPLFRVVKAIYGLTIRILRDDGAYCNGVILDFIRTVPHVTFAIDYKLHKSGRKFFAEYFALFQGQPHLGKPSVTERFFAFAQTLLSA